MVAMKQERDGFVEQLAAYAEERIREAAQHYVLDESRFKMIECGVCHGDPTAGRRFVGGVCPTCLGYGRIQVQV